MKLEFATEPLSGTEAKAKVQPSPRERYKLVESLPFVIPLLSTRIRSKGY